MPPCPASMMALRGFIESVTTRDAGERWRSRSANVGTSSWPALCPTASAPGPYATLCTLLSSVHDAFRVPRHQAFRMMPCVAGKAPVPMVA